MSCFVQPACVRTEVPATKMDRKTSVCVRLDTLGNTVKQVHMHAHVHKNHGPPEGMWAMWNNHRLCPVCRGWWMPAQPLSEWSHLSGWTWFVHLRLSAELHRRAVWERSAETNDKYNTYSTIIYFINY